MSLAHWYCQNKKESKITNETLKIKIKKYFEIIEIKQKILKKKHKNIINGVS